MEPIEGRFTTYIVTATKTLARNVVPVVGAECIVDGVRVKIARVMCEEDAYVIDLEGPALNKELAAILGENPFELKFDDWYKTVIELGAVLSINDWRISCYREPEGLLAAA